MYLTFLNASFFWGVSAFVALPTLAWWKCQLRDGTACVAPYSKLVGFCVSAPSKETAGSKAGL